MLISFCSRIVAAINVLCTIRCILYVPFDVILYPLTFRLRMPRRCGFRTVERRNFGPLSETFRSFVNTSV